MIEKLAAGLGYFDLHFQGLQKLIAAVAFQDSSGAVIVDPGPSTTLPALKQTLASSGLRVTDVTAVLLTHIHLDHAGATGALVRENPRMRVFVHERGAPHMIDPTKLLASATRLFGDAMDRLFGEFAPVPADAIVALRGDERLEICGRRVDVAYTPGHAAHHVSYFVPDAGIAFVGDTAGIRLPSDGFVLPPTPPPDFNLEDWHDSLDRLARWKPETLFVTHYGPWMLPGTHLAEVRQQLAWELSIARASLTQDTSDDERKAWFIAQLRDELRRVGGAERTTLHELAGRFDLNWLGLARYLRKSTRIG